jgi:hypothetical protein
VASTVLYQGAARVAAMGAPLSRKALVAAVPRTYWRAGALI